MHQWVCGTEELWGRTSCYVWFCDVSPLAEHFVYSIHGIFSALKRWSDLLLRVWAQMGRYDAIGRGLRDETEKKTPGFSTSDNQFGL